MLPLGLVHLHFLAAGCLFTWATAGPDPAPHRPGFALRLGVLFASVATHGHLSKLMYAHRWPRGTHHSLTEIQDAARWMYSGGDLAEALLAVTLFAGWYRTRRRRYGPVRAVANVT
jgi:putative membrane protein